MVNAPESAQGGRPDLKATHRNGDALSKVRQNWYVYFRDGAFTFARYGSSCVGFAHSDHGCLFLWFYTRSGFIRGLHFGTSPFFTHAHTGGPMRDFTSERSEVKSRPSQHQRRGPRASRPTWGPGRTPRAGDAPRCTEGRGAARFHFGTLRGEVPLIPKPTAGTRSDHAAHRAMVRRSER